MKFNSRKDGICESPTLVKSSSCVSGNFYTMVELNPLNNDSRDVESAVSISIDTGKPQSNLFVSVELVNGQNI
jgi:hypothetical protein